MNFTVKKFTFKPRKLIIFSRFVSTFTKLVIELITDSPCREEEHGNLVNQLHGISLIEIKTGFCKICLHYAEYAPQSMYRKFYSVSHQLSTFQNKACTESFTVFHTNFQLFKTKHTYRKFYSVSHQLSTFQNKAYVQKVLQCFTPTFNFPKQSIRTESFAVFHTNFQLSKTGVTEKFQL